MKVFINDNNEVKAVNTTTDESLIEVLINDETNPFKDWHPVRICCYMIEVTDGEVTMMTPYVDTNAIDIMVEMAEHGMFTSK